MFRVTFYCLDPTTVTPSLEIGIRDGGKISASELMDLLTRFCRIDPAENAMVEPEIRVEANGVRHIFQTGAGKLHLFNARDRQAPAHVVTPAEALAEFTRSPSPRRRVEPVRVPRATPDVAAGKSDELVYVPPPPSRPSRRVPILLGTLALLLAGLTYTWIDQGDSSDGGAPVVPLPAAELSAARRSVVGVFMAAGPTRRHGIALTEDGGVKLFRDNPVSAPSVVRDTFAPGRQRDKLVLLVEGLGTVIEVADASTLVYCGETFRRIQ